MDFELKLNCVSSFSLGVVKTGSMHTIQTGKCFIYCGANFIDECINGMLLTICVGNSFEVTSQLGTMEKNLYTILLHAQPFSDEAKNADPCNVYVLNLRLKEQLRGRQFASAYVNFFAAR